MQKRDQSIAISLEDFILHTDESPFCGTHPTCGTACSPRLKKGVFL